MGVANYAIYFRRANAQSRESKLSSTAGFSRTFDRILKIPDTCVAYRYANRSGKIAGVGFYRFPADSQKRELWEKAVSACRKPG